MNSYLTLPNPRFDGWENHMLILDNYSSGPTAPYKSSVLLEKSPAGEE